MDFLLSKLCCKSSPAMHKYSDGWVSTWRLIKHDFRFEVPKQRQKLIDIKQFCFLYTASALSQQFQVYRVQGDSTKRYFSCGPSLQRLEPCQMQNVKKALQAVLMKPGTRHSAVKQYCYLQIWQAALSTLIKSGMLTLSSVSADMARMRIAAAQYYLSPRM